ncbi:hypothetical protein NP233_g8816 [Leucocoprinus birnbaumii]|uniref:ER-bound oxygenase mpaB/mpaB'/Rubber oxygenase catalytic domain-containing protein n=1 Tax=Leucocoprinus birnbaumii TaxID=56174 RepID=A0AAD5VLV0_9AGAR|nr:hypothetical protein NP233_g8816 [Leucocoprinus birnbaumii]
MAASAATLVNQLSRHFEALAPHVSDALNSTNLTKGLVTAFVGYLALVRVLRFERYRVIHRKYQKKYEDRTLTPEEAQKVMFVSCGYDMPLIVNYSLAFALLKTYAIPSISRLLSATKQLKSNETISKRYADTELMLSTWVACPLSGHTRDDKSDEFDPRAMIAVARMNQLHSKYKILPACLVTIDVGELKSYCIFWIEIGNRMGIQGIPGTPEEMRIWARAYEEECMAPNILNHEVAGYTTEELLYPVPTAFGIRNWVEGLTVCMLDEPARKAMLKPAQPLYKHLIIWALVKSIALFQKWLMLPRADSNYRFPVAIEFNRKADGSINPMMHPNKYAVRPWYKPEPTTIFGKAWERFLVLAKWHSEVPKSSLRSDGYRLEEMGPLETEKVGNLEALRDAEKLMGCPITGVFAR